MAEARSDEVEHKADSPVVREQQPEGLAPRFRTLHEQPSVAAPEFARQLGAIVSSFTSRQPQLPLPKLHLLGAAVRVEGAIHFRSSADRPPLVCLALSAVLLRSWATCV